MSVNNCLSLCNLFLLRNLGETFILSLYQTWHFFQPKQPNTSTLANSVIVCNWWYSSIFKWEPRLSSERKTQISPFGKSVMNLHLWVLLLAELSAICALGIHLVSSTTVRAWGSRPTSFMVISMWREFFRICTASSWEMLRKLRPLTSRIWSPTYKYGDRERLQRSDTPNETKWNATLPGTIAQGPWTTGTCLKELPAILHVEISITADKWWTSCPFSVICTWNHLICIARAIAKCGR